MAELQLDPDEVAGLVRQVITGVLEEFERRRLLVGGRMALTEPEAAELLGLNPWQLRDLRRAGKIRFRRIVGGRIAYTPDDLAAYLDEHLERGA